MPLGSPRHASLDGLRCVAFLAVFYHHSERVPGNWGGIGVSAFFALSGFLITLGLDRDERPVRTALSQFYLRRSLRIFPLYYLTLTALLVAGFLPHAAWYFGYASNVLLYKLRAYDGVRTHFWSLAVEEQFYLLFPLVFLAAARRARVVVLCLLIALSMFSRWWLDDGSGWSNSLLPVCGEYLLWGALAAVALARAGSRLLDGRWLLAIGVALVVLVYIANSPLPTGSPDAIGFALIVLGLWTAPAALVSRALSLPPIVYLGRISYGLYVFHLIVIGSPFNWLRAPFKDVAWIRSEPWILNLAVTIALAAASWHFIERPLLNLRRPAVRLATAPGPDPAPPRL